MAMNSSGLIQLEERHEECRKEEGGTVKANEEAMVHTDDCAEEGRRRLLEILPLCFKLLPYPCLTFVIILTIVDPNDEDHTYSDQQQKNINGIANTFQELFPPSDTYYYASVSVLRDAVNERAQAHGFIVSTHGKSLRCPKSALPFCEAKRRKQVSSSVPPEKRRKTTTSRCGCSFVIRYTQANRKMKDAPEGSVRITDGSVYTHSNGCTPSQAQLISDKRSTGKYTKDLQASHLATIANVIKSKSRVSAPLLRDLMRPLYPESVPISAQDLSNMRFRIRKLIKEGKSALIGIDSQTQDYCINGSNLDEKAEFLDDATRHVLSTLRETLNSEDSSDAVLMENLLETLHRKDPGFTYKIAYAADGSRCGYVYMTPLMRRNFELYGSVLFLDAMKRQQNSVYWPYIGPVSLDGDGRVVLCGESIICSERVDAYAFVVDAILEMAPRRSRESIDILFGDGILSGGSLLTKLRINDSCKIVLDAYHLLEVDWPRYFGESQWPRLRYAFKGYLYAETEQILMGWYQNIVRLVGGNQAWLDYM